VDAVDLRAVHDEALAQGLGVALVEQPYRVAGRRAPPRAPVLDAAWLAVAARLRDEGSGLSLIAGGRSMGARVACRTAAVADAIAVLCLAFPLRPPARGAKAPESRLPELDAVEVPVLVVQGERDRFGMPPPGPRRRVVSVAGDHGLKADPEAVREAVGAWLREVTRLAA
jgi:predicted alpha/beta-hydrolase family hydrolase